MQYECLRASRGLMKRYFESVARYLSTRNKSRDLVSVYIFLPGRQLELAHQVKTKYRFCSPFNVFIAKLRAAIGQHSYTWEEHLQAIEAHNKHTQYSWALIATWLVLDRVINCVLNYRTSASILSKKRDPTDSSINWSNGTQ